MYIILIIFGLLLLLFGGGCTLISLIMMVDSQTSMDNLGVILPYWIPLGLLPLIVGWLLVRAGIRSRRARRAARDKT